MLATGSGKSNLINHLFNQKVSLSAGSAQSVTRDVTFYQGEGLVRMVDKADESGNRSLYNSY